VAGVVELNTFNLPWPSGQCGLISLNGLNTRFFIHTDEVLAPLFVETRRLFVGFADLPDVRLIGRRILLFVFGIQPVAAFMRAEIPPFRTRSM